MALHCERVRNERWREGAGLPVLWIYNAKGERIATLVQGQTTTFRDVFNRQ